MRRLWRRDKPSRKSKNNHGNREKSSSGSGGKLAGRKVGAATDSNKLEQRGAVLHEDPGGVLNAHRGGDGSGGGGGGGGGDSVSVGVVGGAVSDVVGGVDAGDGSSDAGDSDAGGGGDDDSDNNNNGAIREKVGFSMAGGVWLGNDGAPNVVEKSQQRSRSQASCGSEESFGGGGGSTSSGSGSGSDGDGEMMDEMEDKEGGRPAVDRLALSRSLFDDLLDQNAIPTIRQNSELRYSRFEPF